MYACCYCHAFHAKDYLDKDHQLPRVEARPCVGRTQFYRPWEYKSMYWFSTRDMDSWSSWHTRVCGMSQVLTKARRDDGSIACSFSSIGKVVLNLRAIGAYQVPKLRKLIHDELAQCELKICSHLRVKDLDLDGIASQVLDDGQYWIEGTFPQKHCEADYFLRMNEPFSKLKQPENLVIALGVYHRFLVGRVIGPEWLAISEPRAS
ncbi:hypothetical protein IWZ03DRAFT_382688 [Phyllosticta citriasiana]|uniref:Uncharacterized protein n=2 Tax=Phyllosticta citriasiana TaxID=595635 RepID=A0ABR1KF52_9PEZI